MLMDPVLQFEFRRSSQAKMCMGKLAAVDSFYPSFAFKGIGHLFFRSLLYKCLPSFSFSSTTKMAGEFTDAEKAQITQKYGEVWCYFILM